MASSSRRTFLRVGMAGAAAGLAAACTAAPRVATGRYGVERSAPLAGQRLRLRPPPTQPPRQPRLQHLWN